MNSPIQMFAAAAGQLGLALLFAMFLGGLFVYVMTRNYRRMIHDVFRPDLLEEEKPLDRLDVTGFFVSTRTILTNRRVLQLYLRWFLSRRKLFAVALADVHSVASKRSVAWLLLILAAFLAGGVNPAAFLLFLWGLEAKVYTILFDTPFALMPWTRVTVKTGDRALLADFARFYRNAQATWARIRTEKALAASTPPAGAIVDQETDFVLGKTVWVSIVFLMACGVLQRITGAHVGFDDFVFGPVYLAVPVVVARFSRRDGFWVALLGFVGVLTVKFPSSGLTGLAINDGGVPHFTQYFGVLVTLLLVSEASSAITRFVSPSLSAIAALLWLPYVALHMPSVALDAGLYARALMAVGLSAAGGFLAPWMASDAGEA